MTNIISITGPKLLPAHISYRPIVGKDQAECLSEFRAAYPHYQPAAMFWSEVTKTLWIPMQFDAEAKVTEVKS
jgi:hypothetical protein